MSNPIVRIIVFLAAAFAALLLLVEGVMWIGFRAPKRISQRFTFVNDIPGLKQEVTLALDEKGARSYTVGNGSKEYNIMVIGGTATAAFLQNAEDTWWGQLAQLLSKEDPSLTVKVTCMGRDGQGILYGAKWLSSRLAEQPADLVLAAYGFDDIIIHPSTYRYQPNKIDTIQVDAAKGGLKETVKNVSQLARRWSVAKQRRLQAQKMAPFLQKNFFLTQLRRDQQIYTNLNMKYEVPRGEGQDPAMEYADGVKAILAASQSAGAKCVILGEPVLHSGVMGQVEEHFVHRWFTWEPLLSTDGPEQQMKKVVRLDSGWIELELGRYAKKANELCSQQGATYIDLYKKVTPKACFPTAKPEPGKPVPTEGFFIDDVILSDQGATEMAKVVFNGIKPIVGKKG